MNEYEQLLVNTIVIAKVIADELKGNESYANIVKIADELKIEPYQVQAFYKLYERVQTMMVIQKKEDIIYGRRMARYKTDTRVTIKLVIQVELKVYILITFME